MTESDAQYVSKFYLGPGRSGYMTGDDLSEERKKLVKMITMIDNALAMREAAPKTAILQFIATKVEKMEGLKKKLEVASDSQEAFFVDAPPAQQQSTSSSSSSSLFTQVTMSSPNAQPRSCVTKSYHGLAGYIQKIGWERLQAGWPIILVYRRIFGFT